MQRPNRGNPRDDDDEPTVFQEYLEVLKQAFEDGFFGT